jgi:hypothetical protein
MPTTAEKLWEATRSLPEPLLVELLDFAEFLQAKRGVVTNAESHMQLSSLFTADPLTIQRQMRDDWH